MLDVLEVYERDYDPKKPVVQPYLSNEVVQNLGIYDLVASAEGGFEVIHSLKGEIVKIKGEKYLEITETRMARMKMAEKPKTGWLFGR